MAKVSFAKLDIKIDSSVENITIGEFNIEVKKYLPMQEKMEMIGDIINQAADENRFYNPMKLNVFTVIEVVDRYTNLSFTNKQKEDPAKLYDLLVSSGLWEKVLGVIGDCEWFDIETNLDETVKSLYSYQNSIFGILDDISRDYSNLNLEASEIQKKLADPENMSLLKSVLSKLG